VGAIAAGLAVVLLAAPSCASPRQLNVTEEPVARRTPDRDGQPAAGSDARTQGLAPGSSCPTGGSPGPAPAPDPAVTARVNTAWDRIERWLHVHAPATLASLNPPAPPDRIAAAEAAMALRLPPELVASLRRHDGARTDDARVAFKLPPSYVLMSVDASRQDRAARCGRVGQTGTADRDGVRWQPTYVPFGVSAGTGTGTGGDCVFLDTRPAPGAGRVGECDRALGVSFRDQPATLVELLERTADALESGQRYHRGRPYVTAQGGLDWQES
jgi:cell wall assembly regulator SMI1